MNYRILFAIVGLSTLLIFSGCGDDYELVEMPKSEFLIFESYITSAYENEDEGYIRYSFPYYDTVINEGENDIPVDFFEEGRLILKPGSEWDLWEGNESDDLVQVILKNDPILDNEENHLNHFNYTETRFHEILTIQSIDEIAGTVGDDAIQIEATVENTGGSEYGYIYTVTDVKVLTEDINEAEFEQMAIISGNNIIEGEVRITLIKTGYTEDEAELFVSGSGAVGSYDLLTFNNYYYPIEEISFLDQTEIDDEIISIVGKFDGETLVGTGEATIQSYIGDGTLYDGVSFEYPSVLGEVDGGATIYKDWEVASGFHTVADHVDMNWHFTWIAGEPIFLFSLAFESNSHIYIFKDGVVTELGFDDEDNLDFSGLYGMNYFYAPYKGSKETMDDHYGAINAHLSTSGDNKDWQLYQSLENLEDRYFIQTIDDGTGCNYQKIIG
ncbi:MAG: hypothetical protein Q8P27_01225, partial [Candidatus Peregrinibacteria bacterium]|nr:hypothetical protein [Candidatus Peregrinibacteria bacterium]